MFIFLVVSAFAEFSVSPINLSVYLFIVKVK